MKGCSFDLAELERMLGDLRAEVVEREVNG
jgi:hypothetical protein